MAPHTEPTAAFSRQWGARSGVARKNCQMPSRRPIQHSIRLGGPSSGCEKVQVKVCEGLRLETRELKMQAKWKTPHRACIGRHLAREGVARCTASRATARYMPGSRDSWLVDGELSGASTWPAPRRSTDLWSGRCAAGHDTRTSRDDCSDSRTPGGPRAKRRSLSQARSWPSHLLLQTIAQQPPVDRVTGDETREHRDLHGKPEFRTRHGRSASIGRPEPAELD
jgi:hypothetical protein